jgi:DNA modification methylase
MTMAELKPCPFEIQQGDCLELMKNIPDKSVDLIITDPPYGKKADKGTNGFGSAKNRQYVGGWDNATPCKEVFDEMFRISKNVICFGGNYFSDKLPPSNCWIFWDKKGDVAFKNPFADGELIFTTFKKPVKKIVFKQQGFIKESKDERYHPTQKPSELVQMLIEMYSKKGDIICDPFMGGGTTGVACINTDREFIGFEIREDYFEIARKRIEEAWKENDNG